MTALGHGHRMRRIDRHWLRTVAFTLAMVGLVALAMGTDRAFAATALATCGVGFGFFYLVFATGGHFGMIMANWLALYVCLFAFFREANFAAAPDWAVLPAFVLPVAAFLAGCWAHRAAIGEALAAEHDPDREHLPRMVRWLPAALAVGVGSFFMPEARLAAAAQGEALIVSMAVIALFVTFAARDLVLLLIELAALFEAVAGRAHRLVMPVVAFLTYYGVVILVFTCLYRIVEMAAGHAQFRVHGVAQALSFAEALYFSVITMATVGYGDIVPEGALVRVLAGAEVVCGVLLLLFGFAEIMRTREAVDRHRRRPD